MTSHVPFVSLDRQHESIRERLRDAFERVVEANSFVLGAEVEAFEYEFAAYCGAERCVGVNSGTAALTLLLVAAGIGRGDEVIVPAHTFIASALAVHHAGATPVFCDVDDDRGLIDPEAAEAAVSPRTSAVLAVHLYGQVCDMARLRTLADRHGLALFEDAAQAHGATYRGARTGSLGDAAAFSFYPSKNLGALGDGGAVCSSDPTLIERIRALRNLGQLRKGEHRFAGYNERLDGLQAALLRAKLPHLDEWNESRRAHAAVYDETLPPQLRRLPRDADGSCIYHLYPIRLSARDRLARRLDMEGIGNGIHYQPSCDRQPPFARDAGGPFANAHAWAAEELSLPMFESLERSELDRVVETCVRALEHEHV